MKKILYVLGFILLITGCDEVVFDEPQPRKVKALKDIPEIIQGTYLDHNDDSLIVRSASFSYNEPLTEPNNMFLSDSVALMYYKDRYFLNFRTELNDDYYWGLYMLHVLDGGKQLDVYILDPSDVVKLAKLQEITSKVRDIDVEDEDNDYYLFAPKKKDYKKIIADSIFTKVLSFKKIQ